MYVLKNCKLIPFLTEGTELEKADIVVDGECIREIVPCGTAGNLAEDCETVDMEGMTVMPGLTDMHIHLRNLGKDKADPLKPCAVTLDEYIFAQFFLDNGYTVVRDCGDNTKNPSIALRNHINAGKLTGPRLYCSGPTLSPTEFGADAPWAAPNHYDVDDPMDMRFRVRECIQKGSDFIKLYGSGSMMIENGQPGAMIMEPDEMAEAVKIAGRRNTYCAIHMHGAEGCEVAAHQGVRTIEHASFITEDTLRYLETLRGQGHGIVVTISCLAELGSGTAFNGPVIKRRSGEVIDHLRKAADYNILIGWGTDTSLEFYKKDPYAEFRMRSEDLRYSNEEILKQATIYSATLMMKDHLFGTVKAGKYADLIAVDGDPAADIKAMYQRPAHVMKGGVLVR